MKKILSLLALVLFVSSLAAAQSTSVTATVTDSDTTPWVNGTWIVQFVPNPANPNIGIYNVNGTLLTPSQIKQTGTMNGSGALAVTVLQNSTISPSGSSWTIQVCPQATSACGILPFTATTSTLSLSSQLTTTIPVVRFNALAGAYGYTDAETRITLPVGATYWNVTDTCQRYNNGSSWSCVGSGGGGSPGGPNLSIQYNNGGNFGGSSLLTTDGSGSLFAVNGTFTGVLTAVSGVFQNINNSPLGGRTMQALGDSISWGYASGATAPSGSFTTGGCISPYTHLVATQAASTCWTALVANHENWTLTTLAVSGSGIQDISECQIYGATSCLGGSFGLFQTGPLSIATLLDGQNDNGHINGEFLSIFNGTRAMTQWQMGYEDVAYYTLTPNKLLVQTSTSCTPGTGWSNSTLFPVGGLQTTTTSSTITCYVFGTTAYVSVMAVVGQTSNVSVAVDGGTSVTYTTLLSSQSNVLHNQAMGELLRLPNLGNVNSVHTLVITANVDGSGDPVYVNWVDGNGNEQQLGFGPILVALSPYGSTAQNEGNNLNGFRSSMQLIASDMQNDNFSFIWGDLSTPCYQQPIAATPVPECDTYDGIHPINSGHALIANYVNQLIDPFQWRSRPINVILNETYLTQLNIQTAGTNPNVGIGVNTPSTSFWGITGNSLSVFPMVGSTSFGQAQFGQLNGTSNVGIATSTANIVIQAGQNGNSRTIILENALASVTNGEDAFGNWFVNSLETAGSARLGYAPTPSTLSSAYTTGAIFNVVSNAGYPQASILHFAGSTPMWSICQNSNFVVANTTTFQNCQNGAFGSSVTGQASGTTVDVAYFLAARNSTTIPAIEARSNGSTDEVGVGAALLNIVSSTINMTGIAGAGTYCMQISSTGQLSNTGSACGSGSGGVVSINSTAGAFTFTGSGVSCSSTTCTFSGSGSNAFSALTSSTNTIANMVVGTGASLSVSGSGTISATSVPLTGISGLGTGVSTALADNINTTGGFATLPIANSSLASQTANTVLGALTATTPSGLTMPSCSASGDALSWTTSTGFGCFTGYLSASTAASTYAPIFTLTTTGTSGAATYSANVLNIPQYSGGGGSSSLSSLTAATASNTLTNGNNGAQIWNWAQTTSSQTAFTFGETTAATGTSDLEVSIKTIAGSTSIPLTLSNSLTGSQVLSTLQILPTWNTSGVVDAAIFMNVTNTASGTASKLIDLEVGGTSQFNVDKTGIAMLFSQLNIGVAFTNTGFLKFFNGGSSNSLTIGAAAQTVGNSTLNAPNLAGTTDIIDTLGLAQTFTALKSFTAGVNSNTYATATHCANAAAPAVCGSAAAGAIVIPAGSTTVTVNTSAVTALSTITLTADDSVTIASTTCNSTLATLVGGMAITGRTSGTSFTITYNGTIITNPLCITYNIVN